jgi:hypothetical protein
VLDSHFGKDFSFSDPGDPTEDLAPRHLTSFDQAAQEAGRSRIYGGIHFSAASSGWTTTSPAPTPSPEGSPSWPRGRSPRRRNGTRPPYTCMSSRRGQPRTVWCSERQAPGKGSGAMKRLKTDWDDDSLLRVEQEPARDVVR